MIKVKKDTNEKILKVFCPTCNATVGGKVLATKSGGNDDVDVLVSFLSCPICQGSILVFQEWYEFSHNEMRLDTAKTIFPIDKFRLSNDLPHAIRWILEEAKLCNSVKAFNATVIMCRKSIEALCEELNIKGNTLAIRLDLLLKKQLISNEIFDWSKALRLSGNKAAHDIDSCISQQDARDLLDFTIAIVDYVFVFSKRYQSFLERQKK